MDEKTLEFKTLAAQMEKLSKVYDKLIVNKDILEIWYEQFSKCREDWFCEAVTKYISMSQYAPTPANIWEIYHFIEGEYKARIRTLEEFYNHICSIYPGGASVGDECRQEFRRLTYGQPVEVARNVSLAVEQVIRDKRTDQYESLTDVLKEINEYGVMKV